MSDMSAERLTERAAEVLRDHTRERVDHEEAWTCSCDPDQGGDGETLRGRREALWHQAQALADADCLATPEHDRQVAARALRRAGAEAQVVHDSVPGCGEWGDFAEWLSDFATSLERSE